MSRQTLHLEELLSRKVRDREGKFAGRIEEFVAHRKQGQYVIEEFLLGRQALKERLGIVQLAMPLLRWMGASSRSASHRVPWREMDLSDPLHPKIRCLTSELKPMRPEDQ